MKGAYIAFAIAGVLLFLAGRSCGQPKPPQEQAIDTMAIRIEAADSVNAIWRPVVAAAKDEASRYQQDAAQSRRESRRLAAVAAAIHRRQNSDSGQTASPDSVDHTASYDTLLVAYETCERSVTACMEANAAKDRIIAADSVYIRSLEAVRDAGRQIIKSRPSFLSKILPRPSFGYGVTYANRDLVHGPLIALTWRF
jgi:hypothetical protein